MQARLRAKANRPENFQTTKRTLIFETVDGFEHHGFCNDCRTRCTEIQFHFAAVRAFKGRRQIAFKRQTATLAKRRTDEADLRPAMAADKSFVNRRAFLPAKLADFRIKKTEADIQPVLNGRGEHGHFGIVNGEGLSPTGRNLKMASVNARTKNASQPSINFPVPQNQIAVFGTSAVSAP
jgi:hypothetical protein